MITIYRWLLRLASPPLARQYGDAMEETLARRLQQQRGWRRTRVWIRELAMLVALAWTERVGARERAARTRRRSPQHEKGRVMETMGQELRQAVRRLWRAWPFSLATVATLALSIGANAAIFAVVERVVLNPLPYPQSDRLMELDHGSVTLKISSGLGNTSGIYFIYKHRARAIESAALYALAAPTLTGTGDPQRLRALKATPSLSTVLRVPPALGRWFSEEEGKPGGRAVAVLSDGLWTRRFQRDPSIVGRSIQLDDQPVEIIGVMPAGFAFPDASVEVWMPSQTSVDQGFGLFGGSGVARLRDGVSVETARAEMQGLLAGIAEAYPDDPRAAGNVRTKLTATGRLLKDATLGGISNRLWIVLAAVSTVLVVAFLNVANLFLVRTEVRQREVAIRRALGAARGSLRRYFMTESAVLAGLGGALGLFIAWGALRLLVQAAPAGLPRLHEIQLSAAAIAYCLAIATVAALVFGSLPLWRKTFPSALHDTGRGNTATRQGHRVRYVLLAGQVAMALVLLVASGLMVRSFQNLRAIDLGFNKDSTLVFSLSLMPARYKTLDSMVTAHTSVIDRLSALPQVASVSATSCLPLSMGCSGNTIRIEGETYPPGTLPPSSVIRVIAGGYFETMGMRILRGRGITRGDVERKEPVVVVSQAFAARALRDRDPIGVRIASNQPPDRDGVQRLEWLTIIGVVADTPMQRDLPESAPSPMLFLPMSLAATGGRVGPSAALMSYVVRTEAPPLSVVPEVRRTLRSVDDDFATAQVNTLDGLVDRASSRMTFTMVLLALAAGVSLVLGVVGIYGVTSYIVSQRTGEIGVRLALGAAPGGITLQIVRQGGLVALAGIGIGLAAAFSGSRLIASVLYGVSPRDPIVFATMAIVLQIVAVAACWIPARRAATLDPTIALRSD
ncbi:MAG TPA: ABC transporter permease [Vicinamibacterales bacterium]|nr:ABC transporter permease [Vicinamibacterales bacterium]